MPEKIKIDGNSWHCKLYRLHWTDDPKDLCSYARRVFTSLLIMTLVIGIIACILFFSGFRIQHAIREFGGPLMLETLLMFLAVIAVMAALLGGVIALIQYGYKIGEGARKLAYHCAPNLLREWLKAKKEKYCPLVEIDYSENKRA